MVGRASWLSPLACEVTQNALIETAATRESLALGGDRPRPSVVMLGVGLCRRDSASLGVPFDLLGLLLPAEALRRVLRAKHLVILIADGHALQAGAAETDVVRQRRALMLIIERAFLAIGAQRPLLLRSTELEHDHGYRRRLAWSSGVAPYDRAYMRRQHADLAYITDRFGPTLKVGWTVARTLKHHRFLDEVAFDSRFRELYAECPVSFAYCKPGRSRDPRRPKVPPYLVHDASARPLLNRPENLATQLEAAGLALHERSAHNAVIRRLKAITRSFVELGGDLRGGLGQRLLQLSAQLVQDDAARTLRSDSQADRRSSTRAIV